MHALILFNLCNKGSSSHTDLMRMNDSAQILMNLTNSNRICLIQGKCYVSTFNELILNDQ